MAKNTSCLIAAGSELTVAGSSWPPLALMCAPLAVAQGFGQLPGEDGAERGHAQRAADLLEEHPRAAGHAHVPLLHAVLRDQRDHLHEEAHAQAEDHVVERRVEPGGADGQVGQQEHAQAHDGAAEYREDLVPAGPGGHLAGHDRGDGHTEHHRRQRQPADGRRLALDGLLVQRQERHRAEHGQAGQEGQPHGEREVPVLEHVQRQDRLGRPRLGHEEPGGGRHRQQGEPDDLRRGPRVLGSAPGGQQDERGRGHGEQARRRGSRPGGSTRLAGTCSVAIR